jgi:hypothetical protein
MIKIIKADWGGLDVSSIIRDKFLIDNKLNFRACNENFTDPKPFHAKELELVLEYNGEIVEDVINENATFQFPFSKYKIENALIITSCNRIDQICLALSVNSRIINNPFALIVVDGSTPHLDVNSAIIMHKNDDPYNLVDNKNYNSNWNLIEEHIKTLPNIKEYRVIHQSPRQEKQVGEAELMSLGITSASMLGCKYGIKLTGVCHLKKNPFDDKLSDSYIYTWKRSHINQLSTRVLMFRPDDFGSLLIKYGWKEWVHTYDFIEKKLERIIRKYLPTNKVSNLKIEESDIIVDGGLNDYNIRKKIMDNLIIHNLLDCNDKYIKSFLQGNIW